MRRINRRQFAGWAALAATSSAAANPGLGRGFHHGVASGDPLAERVVLWTRVSGYASDVPVTLSVASDRAMTRVIQRIPALASAERDYTVKIDVDGLEPGSRYYYQFTTADTRSPVGRTRTLPTSAAHARLAIVSCANYPAGYFNVYRALGNYNDLDAVVHLGDYLYEYPADGYASSRAGEFGRVSEPHQEVLTLADYRMRHAQYKSDPDLAYAHARQPFILSWDDHEISNDAWTDGAQNHQSNEGSYAERRRAALRAYYEWMPIREHGPAYRRFDIADIATLVMLESRLEARSQPLDYARDLPLAERWFSADGQWLAPGVTRPADAFALPALTRDVAGEIVAVTDPTEVRAVLDQAALPAGYAVVPDVARFERDVRQNPDRRMIGDDQLDWVSKTLAASASAGTHWQVLGNQTLMTEIRAPNFARELTAAEKSRFPSFLAGLIPLTAYELPMNLDAWDGYPAERARLATRLADLSNTLVLAGDTHNAWAGPIANNGQAFAYELGTPSVSSPGITESLKLAPARGEPLFRRANPHLDYVGFGYRGFIELTLTAREADARFMSVSRIDSRQFSLAEQQRIRVPRGG